jgi:hypothetical protein
MGSVDLCYNFRRWELSMVSPYADLIAAAAAKYLPSGMLLSDFEAGIAALIQHESGGDADAVGDGGRAVGLGQMHPEAAADVGFDWSMMKDPAIAIPAIADYLGRQLARFAGDWTWALGAYNQGPTVTGKAYAYAQAVLALKQG